MRPLFQGSCYKNWVQKILIATFQIKVDQIAHIRPSQTVAKWAGSRLTALAYKNMSSDPLSNAMVSLKNYALTGKNDCVLQPASSLLKEVLKVLQLHGYIGNFEFIDDGKSGKFKVRLVGRINNCRAIRPRYFVSVKEFEKYERRYLPAREFGLLIVSTPQGVMSHKEAITKNTGGVLLSYVY